METIVKGRLGYNILEKQLLLKGWDIYVPLLENTKIDCIAIKGPILVRIQIKTLQESEYNKVLPVRKISHNQGEYKIFRYNGDTVDFFVGVDTDTEDLYIVPIDFIVTYKSSISVTKLQPYKNAFNLMEPSDGNIIGEDDDIGEPLTGNPEGK